MNVNEAIQARRAFHSLEPIEIDEAAIRDLANCAGLSPSCFNKQPWRFVFARGEKITELAPALSNGNEWVLNASLIIGVHSSPEMDCRIKGREYYMFDAGLAVGFLVLRATEIGLVAHPIAGFDEDSAKTVLNIPAESRLITLIIVGKRSEKLFEGLSESQRLAEIERPPRKPFDEIARIV